jgi:hypothetical protein
VNCNGALVALAGHWAVHRASAQFIAPGNRSRRIWALRIAGSQIRRETDRLMK